MLKLTNPLYYPLAVLAGGIVLIVGVRFIKLPNFLILPSAAIVSTATAIYLKSLEPDPEKLAQKEIERELIQVRSSSLNLKTTSVNLQQEAGSYLGRNADNMDLLIRLQQACHPLAEIPQKIDELERLLPKNNSVLSLATLEENLQSARSLYASSSGVAKEQAGELVNSLERNLELARNGSSLHLAKLLNLRKNLEDMAGILQELQNQIRGFKTEDEGKGKKIEELCDRLESLQANFDILIH